MLTPEQENARRQLMALSLARLRAWAEHGAPIRGDWSHRWIAASTGPNQVSAELRPCLEIACTECDAAGFGAYEEPLELDSQEPVAKARIIEKAAFERLAKTRCTHCEVFNAPEPASLAPMAALLAVESPDLIK